MIPLVPTGAPVAQPKVLSREERDSLMQAVAR